MTPSLQNQPSSTRVVLFATAERPVDIPRDDGVLSCLLPLGTASFMERVLDSCALAGLREIDLVVSEQPEALRSIVRNGEPWGIQIHWHHAKDSVSPYAVLRGMGLQSSDRVVIGHAHQWVASRVVLALVQSAGLALQADKDLAWTGWLSADAGSLLAISRNAEHADLSARVQSMDSCRCVLVADIESAQANSVAELLQTQQYALNGHQEAAIPASWRRFAWGAASPSAVIHPNAQIEGPVLIGPGCVVEANAELGAGTVLVRDIVIAQGAKVQNTLVMPNTYVGGQITLDNAVAQGNAFYSLKWSVRTVLPVSDALLTPRRTQRANATPLKARALAGALLLLTLPLFALFALVKRLGGASQVWDSVTAVKSRRENKVGLDFVTLRVAAGNGLLDSVLARYGALLDLFQGKRNWFGVRPRQESEWYALGADLQELFGQTAIGFFHAAAWTEDLASLNHETFAAADAFMAIQTTLAGRVKAACAPNLQSA